MVTALQSTQSIMQFIPLCNYVLPKCKIFFKQKMLQIFIRCKDTGEKLAVHDNKSAIFTVKLHMLHTAKCYPTPPKIRYIDS